MGKGEHRSQMKILAACLAIFAAGLGVRFALVHLPAPDAPGMCELVSDFWRGDELRCHLSM